MFETTPEFLEQLKRFSRKTRFIIVTSLMTEDEMEEFAALLARWSDGETDLEAVIESKFAVDPDDTRDY